MKISLLLTVFFVVVLGPVNPVQAQDGSVSKLEKEILHRQQQNGYLNDTAYFNSVLRLAFQFADRYPDSAILLLAGIPAQCRSIKFMAGETESYNALGNAWQTKGNFDSAMHWYNKAFSVAKNNDVKKSIPGILGNIALVYMNRGDYAPALEKFYAAMHEAEKQGDKILIRNCLNNIGTIRFYQGKMKEAEEAYQQTLDISRQLADTANIVLAYNNIGEVNVEQNDLKKAIANLSKASDLAAKKNMADMQVAVSNTLGDCYFKCDSLPKAETIFQFARALAEKTANARGICKADIGLAKVNNRVGHYPPALTFGLEALSRAEKMGQAQLQRDALEIVANIYENTGDGNHAIIYYKRFKKFSDSLVNIENERISSNLKSDYEIAKKEEAYQRKAAVKNWWIISALAALTAALFIVWIEYRNKKRLSHTYKELQVKSKIIEKQKGEAEETLIKLQAAQNRLIQSEKLAGLGELTAGIAHEIQNPLNFVNNFSEVSNDLIKEMQEERAKSKDERNEELENELLADISQNLEKINHHGKRADGIVKSMLQHSRSSSGQKEPTDLNKLADEYLRLAYHGLRAKDKSFNALFKTDFDSAVGKVNIIPQDIGRVILNLVTNAFYAVDEKKKKTISAYEPTVTIKTRRFPLRGSSVGSEVGITVTDNGNGIPKKVIDKIFQPFFTTKPTGQGTGLGLSMSYDIAKAHGGELKVFSNEEGETVFTLVLPV